MKTRYIVITFFTQIIGTICWVKAGLSDCIPDAVPADFYIRIPSLGRILSLGTVASVMNATVDTVIPLGARTTGPHEHMSELITLDELGGVVRVGEIVCDVVAWSLSSVAWLNWRLIWLWLGLLVCVSRWRTGWPGCLERGSIHTALVFHPHFIVSTAPNQHTCPRLTLYVLPRITLVGVVDYI